MLAFDQGGFGARMAEIGPPVAITESHAGYVLVNGVIYDCLRLELDEASS